jgi:hypothetical protein
LIAYKAPVTKKSIIAYKKTQLSEFGIFAGSLVSCGKVN